MMMATTTMHKKNIKIFAIFIVDAINNGHRNYFMSLAGILLMG
jgi:hypothetical protein